jgi:hypothetical protein
MHVSRLHSSWIQVTPSYCITTHRQISSLLQCEAAHVPCYSFPQICITFTEEVMITKTGFCCIHFTLQERFIATYIHGKHFFLISCWQSLSRSRNSSPFMEPPTGPCSQPVQSNPQHPTAIFKIHVLTQHHAMKTYWESGSIAPHILDLGTRWR